MSADPFFDFMMRGVRAQAAASVILQKAGVELPARPQAPNSDPPALASGDGQTASQSCDATTHGTGESS